MLEIFSKSWAIWPTKIAKSLRFFNFQAMLISWMIQLRSSMSGASRTMTFGPIEMRRSSVIRSYRSIVKIMRNCASCIRDLKEVAQTQKGIARFSLRSSWWSPLMTPSITLMTLQRNRLKTFRCFCIRTLLAWKLISRSRSNKKTK